MTIFRDLVIVSLLAAAGACAKDLPQVPPESSVTIAVFDPTTAKIPLPNDLAFAGNLNGVCPAPANELPPGSPLACAQAELVASFKGQFPADQEVAITIDFTTTVINADGTLTAAAPDLNLASFTPSTFIVFSATASGQGPVAIEPLTAASYVKHGDAGTLTIRNKNRAPWPPGSYAVFVRGGDNGVKTSDGSPIYASPVFHLIAQGRDMTDPKNQGLLRAQLGSAELAIEQGERLNQIIEQYKASVYPVVDMVFPHEEIAVGTTFHIDVTTRVGLDPARGQVPLPIDLLRDPTTGRLSAVAACTLAGAQLAANGTCPSPAAAGFQALDGFSTTGAILAPTTDLVRVSSVTNDSLRLYDLTDPANPVQVDPSTLVIEPCEFASACGSTAALSPVIAIQPAGATAGDPTSVFRSRPLKDATNYAVVMTNGILDKAGQPIGSSTVAKILLLSNPLVVGGTSALSGIDTATATLLEKMRLQLRPVMTKLGADAAKVAMAYTFRTQTITSQAVQLAALPYITDPRTALPGPVGAETSPSAVFAKYGVSASVPSDAIDEILEVDITTFNALDNLTGALKTDLANTTPPTLEQIHVLIATPKPDNANIPTCGSGPDRCAPLMVFRHGFRGGRADMLTVANSNAAAGMITVAIDAAKHGDRSFCTSGTSGTDPITGSGCVGGATCELIPGIPVGAQGDAHPPGTCGSAGFIKRPVSTGTAATGDGIPAVSGNFLVSANFFRTRDTLRQDLIDQSQLIRALAVAPPATSHTVFAHIFGRSMLATGHGLLIDPAKIYFSGQSLGAIQGAMDVAANPRISKAVFNVGGGTVVDVFTNPDPGSPFKGQTDALLAGLGITRGSSQFLQFLVVAKTVLDPADPINFVGHLKGNNTLPNLLPPLGGNPNGMVKQLPKTVLVQAANCDATVPNAFNFIFAANAGTSPLLSDPSFVAPTTHGTFQLFVPTGPADLAGCTSATAVPHGFLTNWTSSASSALATKAQSDLTGFVMSDTQPLSLQHP